MIGLRILKRKRAVELDVARKFLELPVANVSDCMSRMFAGGARLRPMHRGGPMAGPAFTVKTRPGDNLMIHKALWMASPGDVIVVDAGCWGGILTLGASLRGVAGVVADGPVRDVDEARGLDFPVFARASTARTARGRIVELGTGVPVRIGDVNVGAGDFVIADGSAVVFVRAADLERVVEAAEQIAAREAAMADALRAGRPITEVMGASYEHLLK